jgi:hypothetical protein
LDDRPNELIQIMPEQAAETLIKAGFDLPPHLAEMVRVIAGGGDRTFEQPLADPPSPGKAVSARGTTTSAPANPPTAPAPSGTAAPAVPREEEGTPPPASLDQTPFVEPHDLVTLDQVAAIVHKTKRALEYHKTKGTLPAPYYEGGGGKAALYDWKVIGPWLTEKYGFPLPDRYPGR